MHGWIKLHRQLSENPLWLIKPFSEGQAWIDLLLITTFDEGYIKTKNGTVIKLKRGECGYSQLTLSNRWGWSRGKVNRFLKLLKCEKMIQQKIVSNTTIISILNYDVFQNDTINDTINGQQTDTIKNVKNDKNDYNNISLSINNESKKITKEEREILKNYLLRQKRKPDNPDAYLKTLIQNGDWIGIVEKERRRLQAREEKRKEKEAKPEIEREDAETVKRAMEAAHDFIFKRGVNR